MKPLVPPPFLGAAGAGVVPACNRTDETIGATTRVDGACMGRGRTVTDGAGRRAGGAAVRPRARSMPLWVWG